MVETAEQAKLGSKTLLEEAVKDSGYTRIEIVKVAYMDYLVSERQVRALQNVLGGNLPKHTYNDRVGGMKRIDRTSALRRGNRKLGINITRSAGKTSKHMKFFDKLMTAQQRSGYLYDRFEALARQLTPEEQNSIMTGVPLPVNVMADKPKKQSIVTQINSSGEHKIEVNKKVV